MRYLVLIAVLAGAARACRDAVAPAGPSLASEASARTLVDLREARTSLIAARERLVEVWGYREHVSSRTVDTHVAVLRRKLGHRPEEPGYVVTVAKVGYRLRE